MKNSTARQGAIHLTPEERGKIASLKENADARICLEGVVGAIHESPLLDCHRATLSGIDVAFILNVDPEEGIGQYQLHLTGRTGQPGLDVVQAMAALFFGDKTYQIMPDERHPGRVRVMGLFFPYPVL